ncbi:hypothetical protein HDU96_002868 [Phlyctochytrium bullatum]|nr:hypothetical protein HDU96_002868 [Phlyctochytrium bullatum]
MSSSTEPATATASAPEPAPAESTASNPPAAALATRPRASPRATPRRKDPKALAEMQAMLAQARIPKLQNQYITDLENETKHLDATTLPPNNALYIRKLKNCTLVVDSTITKVLIEDCEGTSVTIKGRVITQMLEIWRCNGCKLEVNTTIQTVQVDMCQDLKMHFAAKDHFSSMVWAKSENIQLSFGDYKGPELNADGIFASGLELFKAANPETQIWPDLDQFIVRFLKGVLTTEIVIRVGGGYASTDREDTEAVKRKNMIMEKVAETFFKSVDFKSLTNHVKSQAQENERRKRAKIEEDKTAAAAAKEEAAEKAKAAETVAAEKSPDMDDASKA